MSILADIALAIAAAYAVAVAFLAALFVVAALMMAWHKVLRQPDRVEQLLGIDAALAATESAEERP